MSTESSNNKSVSKSAWVVDLAAFAATALCMHFLDWKAKDLLWGLWICSLTFGLAYMMVMLIAAILYQDGVGRIIIGVIGGVALYLIGSFFVLFHVGQAVFLHNMFVPLVDGDVEFDLNRESASIALKYTLLNYWPLVVTTFMSRYSDFSMKGIEQLQKGGVQGVRKAMFKPFINVMRMHFLIIFLMFMRAADRMEWAVYLVLLFYFFPWGSLIRGKKSGA